MKMFEAAGFGMLTLTTKKLTVNFNQLEKRILLQ